MTNSVQPSYTYRARLGTHKNGRNAIYDADTMALDVDLGFGIWLPMGNVRLFGIDAYEVRGDEKIKGIPARDWVREQIKPGDTFTIKTVMDSKGKYGRFLVHIYLDRHTEDFSLNDELVKEEFAVYKEY